MKHPEIVLLSSGYSSISPCKLRANRQVRFVVKTNPMLRKFEYCENCCLIGTLNSYLKPIRLIGRWNVCQNDNEPGKLRKLLIGTNLKNDQIDQIDDTHYRVVQSTAFHKCFRNCA